MDKRELTQWARNFAENSEFNQISERAAMRKDIVGMRIFETPIFGFAKADDYAFEQLREKHVIGSHHMLPKQWLPSAKTVIAMFLPFTQRVIDANAADMSWPSAEWLHARIEGQQMIGLMLAELEKFLTATGYASVVPGNDPRFWSNMRAPDRPLFTSNWSERHVAYVCGLGAFGLSRGLITEKGMAGRLASVVTEFETEPKRRPYASYNTYCTMCGACVRNCPVGAISFEFGKNQELCDAFVDETAARHRPYYGCGKCQVKTPCSAGIPRQV